MNNLSDQPLAITWHTPWIGTDSSGVLYVRKSVAVDSLMYSLAPAEFFRRQERLQELEDEVQRLSFKANRNDPTPWIMSVVAEIESRCRDAGKLRGDTRGGAIMFGQSQAYADSAELILAYVQPEDRS